MNRVASRKPSAAIAAGHPQTAQAGVDILRRGGNAIDAAVAAAFASFVVEYPMVNIGGSGIATLVDGTTGACTVIDFFSDMPSGTLTHASDFREITVNYGPTTQPFYIGRASVAVPGAVAGLSKLAAAHGTLPLATLLEPAIAIANNGVLLTEAMAIPYQLLQPIFTDTAELAAQYVPNGKALQAGEYTYFPQLAATLHTLGQQGVDYFYRGELAQALVADQQRNGGLLTADDLANYRAYEMTPIAVPYREFTLLLPSASSTGGVLTAFSLMLLASLQEHGLSLAGLNHNSTEHIQILAEVMRQTNIARATWDADGAPIQERVDRFLGKAHLSKHLQQLQRTLRGAQPPEREPSYPPGPSNTTHISVADNHGNVVSMTTSSGESAGYVLGDTGVCLNNMLGETDLHPGGFHQLPPGQRLATMMTPVIVFKDGAPFMAVGSGGANRIRSAILQSISNVLDFGMDAQAAVNARRVHFEENVLQLEGGIPSAVAEALTDGAYTVNQWSERHMFFGGAHMVIIQEGTVAAAGDLRRGGSVAIP